VIHGKPHPEPYLKGAERLGFPPGDCLVIEDAPAGIQAAHAGGMKVIGLMSTFGAAQLKGADLTLKSLDQIQIGLNGAGRLVVSVG
jgi:sugar-phosphatase